VELLAQFIDIILHVDKYLAMLLAQYGTWIYAILFLIVFCETGLVVTPFLPGDSLLFVAGALAATSGGSFQIEIVIGVLLAAAILGDNTNYWIGRWAGKRILAWGETHSRFFNRKAFDMTHAYYEAHGGKTMLVARFMPFVRTFAPFVAGVGNMSYPRYFAFDLAGAFLWVFLAVPGRLLVRQHSLGQVQPVADHLRHHRPLAVAAVPRLAAPPPGAKAS
jgi:membrane-associated protein